MGADLYFAIITATTTTLGMIVSLYCACSGSNIKLKTLVGGILGLALSDSFADGFGIYYFNRGEGDSRSESQELGLYTALYKCIFTLSFLPFLFMYPGSTGIILSIIWTHLAIIYVTYKIEPSVKEIIKHLGFVWVIVIAGYCGGKAVEKYVK